MVISHNSNTTTLNEFFKNDNYTTETAQEESHPGDDVDKSLVKAEYEPLIDIGEPGPLLLALLLNNQNNNPANVPGNNQNPQVLVPAATIVVQQQELEPQMSEINDVTVSPENKPMINLDEPGPLLLTLLMGNNNNNAAAQAQAATPATVAVGQNSSASKTEVGTENIGDHSVINIGDPGPLLLTLLLVNNNNNQAAQSGTVPPSTVVSKQIVAEVQSDVLRARNEKLVLRLRGDEHPSQGLSQSQIEFWNQNGYILVPDAMSSIIRHELLETARSLIDTVFEGGEGIIEHTLTGLKDVDVSPVGKLLVTFEFPSGYDSKTGLPNDPNERVVGRIGCGVHQQVRSFREITFSDFHRAIAKQLGHVDPRVTQSMIIPKPKSNTTGRVAPHQDGTASFSDPATCITFWYALEDSTLENGCLSVIPGTHRTEGVKRRIIRTKEGRAQFVDLEKSVFPVDVDFTKLDQQQQDQKHQYKPLEVKAGTLILMHGNTMHKSEPNRSKESRFGYTFSVIDGQYDTWEDAYLRPLDGTTYESLMTQI